MTRFAFILILLTPPSTFAQDYEKLLDKIDPLVFPPGSNDAKSAPALFGKMLKAERDRVNRDDVAVWKSLAAGGDKADWEKFAKSSIEALKQSLGTLPVLQAKEVRSHISKTLDGAGFAIDNLVYESRPGLWVTANLYRPVPLRDPAPGILIVHSHHNPKTEGELQDMGIMWARAGCYVLIPDQLGHGERRQHPFADKSSFPGPFKVGRQDYYFRYNVGMQLHLVGESLIGWMARDIIAGVTLLLEKRAIDPARIIVMGSVAGGGDPAAVAAAIDNRIQCLVPFNFGGPQPETKYPLPEDVENSFDFMGSGSWESTRNLADSAAEKHPRPKNALPGEGRFLPWTIVASIAPRRLIHAHEFSWDGDRDPVWKRYETIWSWYGAGDNIAVAHGKGMLSGKPPEASHCNNIGPEHRAMIHPILKKWFNISADETGVKAMRRPAAELQCWTPELKEMLKPKMVHELALETWTEEPRIGPLPVPARGARFSESQTGVVFDRTDDSVDGIAIPRVLLEGKQYGLRIPILILSPKEKADGRMVIALSPRGKQPLLTDRRAEIAGLLREGIAVCLPDLPGTGEVGTSDSRGRSSAATSHSSTLRMFGTSMAAQRLNHLGQVVEFLMDDAASAKRDLRFCVWAESTAPVNDAAARIDVPHDADPAPKIADPMMWAGVPLAFSLSGPELRPLCRGVMTRGSLVSFKSALESPFIHVPHEDLDVPFMAMEPEELILTTLWPAKNPTKIRIVPMRFEGMIDAQNRPASQKDIDQAFARLRERADNHFQISARAERNSADELVRWFVERLR